MFREGGHEQTHIALGALPKMVKNALDGRVCGGREERPVKIAVPFPELDRGRIVRYRLKANQRTPYRLDVAFGHSRHRPPPDLDLYYPSQIIDVRKVAQVYACGNGRSPR
jgi:hypothetical protein